MKNKKILIWVYKIAAVLVALLFVFSPKLFTHNIEVGMRIIVTALGIDKRDDEIYAYAQVLSPIAGSGTEIVQKTIESKGKTISMAIDGLNIAGGAKADVTHCDFIVFGRDACEAGVLPECKALLADGFVNAGILIFASEYTDAKTFMEKFAKLDDTSLGNVNSFVSYFEKSLYMQSMTLYRFIGESACESGGSSMPCVKFDSEDEEGGNAAASAALTAATESKDSGAKEEETNITISDLTNVVVFNKGKRVRMLSQSETEGYIWFDKESKRGFLEVEDFSFGNENLGHIAAQVINKKIKVKYGFKDNKPHISIKLKAEINIQERHIFSYYIDKGIFNQKEIYAALNAALSNKIESLIREGVNAMKECETDFFNFRYWFARFDSKQLKAYEGNSENNFIQDLTVDYNICCNAK